VPWAGGTGTSLGPGTFIDIRKFRTFTRENRMKEPPLMVSRKMGRFYRDVEDLRRKGGHDMVSINSGLLQVARKHFPARPRTARIQRPYMYKSTVRVVSKERRDAARRLNKVRGRTEGEAVARAEEALVAADKKWVRVRREAQREQMADMGKAIERGNMSVFYAMFKMKRMAKPPRTPPTRLDPQEVANFFRKLFSDPESAQVIQSTMPAPPSDDGDPLY